VYETIKTLVLQALVFAESSDKDKALQALGYALTLAEPGGFIRLFVDEGEPMKFLISDCRHLHRAADAVQVLQIKKQSPGQDRKLIVYIDKILAAFPQAETKIQNRKSEILVEPLSQRELEILKLIDKGLSNREISARLFLALSTVKGHNRILFDKLHVQSRTEAIARARELGLL